MLLGPQPVRMNINDGLGEDLLSNAPHWEVARMLLDQVRPAGDAERAPGRDEMVRHGESTPRVSRGAGAALKGCATPANGAGQP
jgi:hypothetical protein